MNPRILKKLSKKADAYVQKLTDLKRFVVDDGEIYSYQKVDKKHRERWSGTPNRYGYFSAKNGTIGYGSMVGYYEPEWEENDAYSILKEIVADHFYPDHTKKFKTPHDVFKFAKRL